MRTRRKALLFGAIALVAVLLALLLQEGERPAQSAEAATVLETRASGLVPTARTAAAPPSRVASPPARPPIFDLVRVEKDEVCEGEENLVTVHAHTTDGNDAFLHYTVAGEAGAQVPVRAYVGRDGKAPPQYAVAFSRDNVATRVELPPYVVKNCRPARILIVTMRMLPNSLGSREFTAAVQVLDGVPFTPAWYEWSFGDDGFDVTAGPVAVHDYSRLPQRTAYSDLLVKAKALDGSGQSVEGRLPVHIRNIAFETRRSGVATIFAEPTPRFPEIGPDGVVHQKFRVWHSEDTAVLINGATLTRLFLPSSPGTAPPPPSPVAVDPARIMETGELPPGVVREQSLDYDFGADAAVYAVTYEIQGVTTAGMQARGNLTLLRPPPRPTRENSVPIDDPAMILKIRRAMAILKQDTVSQEDLWRLEREGKLQ